MVKGSDASNAVTAEVFRVSAEYGFVQEWCIDLPRHGGCPIEWWRTNMVGR